MGNTRFQSFAVEYEWPIGEDWTKIVRDHILSMMDVNGAAHVEYEHGDKVRSCWFITMKYIVYGVQFDALDIELLSGNWIKHSEFTIAWRKKLYDIREMGVMSLLQIENNMGA